MQETIKRILIYGRDMWRYRWYAIAMAWIVVLAGWAFVSKIPNNYTASAQLHVDTITVLKPLLKGLVIEEDNAAQQLGLMTELLVSRPNLEQVARMVQFDRQAQTPQQWEAKLFWLKQNILISGSKTNFRASYLDLYTISYADSNPELAKQVVQALITTFMEKTLGKTRQDSAMAKEFLEQQIREYDEKLMSAENRLREFKRQYIDILPEQQMTYFERLQAAQSAAADITLQINENESKHRELLRQLQQTPANQRPISIQGTPALTPAESRLIKLQARLEELLINYTEAYPEVKETRRMIANLKKQQALELKELSSNDSATSMAVINPEYQQLRIKLRAVEEELAVLRARLDEYQKRIQTLQQQRETIPTVEAELQRLNRDYQINKENYNALVTRREAMKISQDIQKTDEDVKFETVDAPRVLMWQTWRKRIMLITGVLVMGLIAGVLLAFMLTRLRPVVYGRRALHDLTGFPVFGAISQVKTSAMRLNERLDLIGFALTGLVMLAVYGVVLSHQLRSAGLEGILNALGAGK